LRVRRALLLVCAGVWVLILQTPAWSILIETAPNKRVVGGYLVSEDAKKLVLRIPIGGGKVKDETFERSKVKILHRVDRERLEKLTKDTPSVYREYADELAAKKADPEAKELALRLYLIAAYLDPAKFGRSCLLSMTELANNPADARKYRAMAYLLDANSDQSLLKSDPAAKAKPPESAWKSFQSALRKFRNGDVIDAREAAKGKDVATCFASVPGMMDQDTFIQACTDSICPQCKYNNRNNFRCPTCMGRGKDNFGFQPCPTCKGKGIVKCSTCDGTGINRNAVDDNFDAVVRAELWSIEHMLPNAPAPEKRSGPGTWASAVSNPQLTPIPVLTLETITEYDPRKCVFRNGSWVAP
jgi:hypothetical protein